jgi:hypothetical protein
VPVAEALTDRDETNDAEPPVAKFQVAPLATVVYVANRVPVAGRSAVDGAVPEYTSILPDDPTPTSASVVHHALAIALTSATFMRIVPLPNGTLKLKLLTTNATPAIDVSVGTVTPLLPPDNPIEVSIEGDPPQYIRAKPAVIA